MTEAECASQPTWSGWRWIVVGFATGALVLGLGLVFRRAGLGGAADTAQIVSLASPIAGLSVWARHRQPHPSVSVRGTSLDELLCIIAEAHGLTRIDLRAKIHGWSSRAIDAYMDGEKLPEWDFVTAFLDVICHKDRLRHELLERRFRRLWKTLSNERLPKKSSNVGGSRRGNRAARKNSDWIAALRVAARSRQVVNGVQKSIRRCGTLNSGLAEMLERLIELTQSLTEERDDLHNLLEAWSYRPTDAKSNSDLRAELQELRRNLHDAQESLDRAERLRDETECRLAESEDQRRVAERLKVTAVARADQALRHLAKVEGAVPSTSYPGLLLRSTGYSSAEVMKKLNCKTPEEILSRVDGLLLSEAANLSRLSADLTKPKPIWTSALARCVFGSIVLLAAIVGVATYYAVTHVSYRVPPVNGMLLSQAEKAIKRAHLSYEIHSVPSSAVRTGIVIWTSPPTGSTIRGGRVTLEVSSGPRRVVVPKVLEMKAADAAQKLKELGLRIHRIEVRESILPRRAVIRQVPNPGVHVRAGFSVTVWISPGDVKVPRVLNDNIEFARNRLARAGLSHIVILYVADSNLPNGTVLNQSPDPGRVTLPNRRITLTVVGNNPSSQYSPVPPVPTPTRNGSGGNGSLGGGGTGGGPPHH